MSQFPLFRLGTQRKQKTSANSPRSWRNVLALGLAALLFFAPLSFNISAQQGSASSKSSSASNGDFFILYRNALNDAVCREATQAERGRLEKINADQLELHPITSVKRQFDSSAHSAGTNAIGLDHLKINLNATTQLEGFPEAKAAFIRAKENWEAQILSPIEVNIKVDFGPKNGNTEWEPDVLGATGSSSRGYDYQSVRASLIAGASTPAETALYNSLPAGSLPTDAVDATTISVPTTIARAMGLPNSAANPSVMDATIAFNSNFDFDFNPADGITFHTTDFEAVATHEIGHALGFVSRAGSTSNLSPTIWDMFRFRTGVTLSTFATAQRVMSASGLQYYFSGTPESGLSTGGPNGDATGGDGNQSSHWKQANLNGGYIGIMDPRIPSGIVRKITPTDTIALNSFGYNLDNSNPPPPPPPPPSAPANNNFASAKTINGCTIVENGTNIAANKEAGEPSHNPDPQGEPGRASVWYQWQSPSNGSVTVTTAGGQTNYDTMIGVYTGTSVGALSVIGKNDDLAEGNTNSSLTFNAIAGTVYKIAVDGWGDETGSFTLSLTASNCTVQPPQNPIDDAKFFVGQHYQDFLGRTADAGGLGYWSEQISGNSSNNPPPCALGDAQCEHVRRISVSAAFFVENEFQRTGGFVYRFYKVSYGVRPTFQQFKTDRALVYEGDGLEARKQAFASAWVQRPEFIAKYPATLGGAAFIDALVLNVQQNSGVNLTSLKASLLNDFNAGGRARVVRSVADNATLAQAEFNAAFVLMQYFGYLQRNPDDGGYQFWLGILNDHVPNNFRAMVCAFLTSAEYQQRFGAVVTRSNSDCAFVGP